MRRSCLNAVLSSPCGFQTRLIGVECRPHYQIPSPAWLIVYLFFALVKQSSWARRHVCPFDAGSPCPPKRIGRTAKIPRFLDIGGYRDCPKVMSVLPPHGDHKTHDGPPYIHNERGYRLRR